MNETAWGAIYAIAGISVITLIGWAWIMILQNRNDQKIINKMEEIVKLSEKKENAKIIQRKNTRKIESND